MTRRPPKYEYTVADYSFIGRGWGVDLFELKSHKGPQERTYGFKSEQEAEQFAKVKWPHAKRSTPWVPRKTVYSVREYESGDQQGFLITGGGTRVFARTRRGAEEIRDAYKKGARTQIDDTISRVFAEEKVAVARAELIEYNIFSRSGFEGSHASLTSAEEVAKIAAKRWKLNMTVIKAVRGETRGSAGTIVSVWGPDGKVRRVKTPSRANPAWAKVFG